MDRVLAPAPANGAALNVSTGAQSSPKSPCRVELLGTPKGENGKRTRAYGSYSVLSPVFRSFPARSTQYPVPFFRLYSVLSPAFTPSRRHGLISSRAPPRHGPTSSRPHLVTAPPRHGPTSSRPHLVTAPPRH